MGSGIFGSYSGGTDLVLTNALVVGNVGAAGDAQLAGTIDLRLAGGNLYDGTTPYAAVFGSNVLADNGGFAETLALVDDPSNPAVAAGARCCPTCRTSTSAPSPGRRRPARRPISARSSSTRPSAAASSA